MKAKQNFWSTLYERSQTKMMYLPNVLGDSCVYFRNTISEPQKLIEFIEECEKDQSTHKYLTSWSEMTDSIMFKKFLLEESDISKRNKQKLLYIYNSFKAGIDYCKEHYSNFAKQETSDIKPLYLFKSKPLSEGERDQEYSLPDSSQSISVYLMMNTEAEGKAFCLNKEKSIYIYPEPWSIVMVPDNLSHSEGINANSELYYLKTKFELGAEKLQCSNLL
jgi:hypothetical protein